MEEADLLLDRPPGGWDDLVTKEWLHLELAVLDARMDALEQGVAKIDSRLDQISRELRSQTWRLVTVLVAGMGIAIGAARF